MNNLNFYTGASISKNDTLETVEKISKDTKWLQVFPGAKAHIVSAIPRSVSTVIVHPGVSVLAAKELPQHLHRTVVLPGVSAQVVQSIPKQIRIDYLGRNESFHRNTSYQSVEFFAKILLSFKENNHTHKRARLGPSSSLRKT